MFLSACLLEKSFPIESRNMAQGSKSLGPMVLSKIDFKTSVRLTRYRKERKKNRIFEWIVPVKTIFLLKLPGHLR